jgi:hypothetical protein
MLTPYVKPFRTMAQPVPDKIRIRSTEQARFVDAVQRGLTGVQNGWVLSDIRELIEGNYHLVYQVVVGIAAMAARVGCGIYPGGARLYGLIHAAD